MNTPLRVEETETFLYICDAGGNVIARRGHEDGVRETFEEIVQRVNATEWTPADEHPDDWVLITVNPLNGRTRPYVIMAMFDAYRGYWRTKMGRLDDKLAVLGWQELPQPMEVER